MGFRKCMRAGSWPVGLLVVLLASCSTSGGAGRSSSGEIRPVEELPEAYRELWMAFMEERPDWPERRAAALADPAQEVFLVDNLVRTLLRSFQRGTIGNTQDPVTLLFKRTGTELVALGTSSAPALAEVLALGNGQGPALASELLVRIGSDALDPLVVQLGREDQVDARRRSAALLADMPFGLHGAEERVRAALVARLDGDEDWLVRERCANALGVRALRDTSIDDARRALGRALFDEDREVRRRAANALVRIGDPLAVPALINLLERSTRRADPGGLTIAQEALLRITGETERRNPHQWRTWWRDNRPLKEQR